MSFIKLLAVAATLLVASAVVVTTMTLVNFSRSLESISIPDISIALPAIDIEKEPQFPPPVAEEIAESPIDVAVTTSDRTRAVPMPAGQVEWTETPYPEPENGNVFSGFGSEDPEAQAEVEALFDELLEDFALQAQSIDRNATAN